MNVFLQRQWWQKKVDFAPCSERHARQRCLGYQLGRLLQPKPVILFNKLHKNNFKATKCKLLYTCTEESSLMVTVPLETKYFLEPPSFSITVTTPGFNTARVGTCLGRIPNAPEKDGTSTCLTDTPL